MKKTMAMLLAVCVLLTSIAVDLNLLDAFASMGGANKSADGITRAAVGAETMSFAKGGTLKNPTVDVSIFTDGKQLIGLTYERGYNKTATPHSKRIYGHEEKVGTVNFSITNVNRYVSVMAIFKDTATGALNSIVENYELTGQRIYNSGSGTFSMYPTTPLNDNTNKDTLVSDKMDDMAGSDNGPLVVADDEIWIFTQNGAFQVYNMDDIDEYFNTSTDIEPVYAGFVQQFNEISASVVFDGRYIIYKNYYGRLGMIEAATRKVVVDDTKVDETIISGYRNNANLYGNIRAITYDHEYLYLLGGSGATGLLYRGVRNPATGNYAVESTPVATFTNGVYGSYSYGNDMLFDGENIWIARNQASVLKYNVTTKVTTTYNTTGGAFISRIVYDGSQYIYGIGIQGLGINTDLGRFDKTTGAYSVVYPETPVADSVKEDLTYDGRNIWVNSYSVNDANRYRYDTVTGTREEIPLSRWQTADDNTNETLNNSIGVYDGKYLWHWQYSQNRVNVIGHMIDLNYGSGAKGTNLEKFFKNNPGLSTSTTVYVDDKATTVPDYVDVKLKSKGNSTSKIVYAAWAYDDNAASAATRNSDFFADLNNFADDDNIKDKWVGYADKKNKYFTIDRADLPVLNADGTFDFNFRTYPKQNGYYTLYMINDEYRPYYETIYIDNYQIVSTLFTNFVDDETNEVIISNMDDSVPFGSKTTVYAEKFLDSLAEKGYILNDANKKEVTVDTLAKDVNFRVTKDKTKWTEIIKKPYYLNDAGDKVYIGTEIATGQYYLVSPEGTTVANQKSVIVDAPHIDTYSLVKLTDATKTVKLPHTNGGTPTAYGRTVVEFEFEANDKVILATGIEVDASNIPTGNLVYTQQFTGGEKTTGTITAREDLENWELVGLANYDNSGDFTNVSPGIKTKAVTYGTDTEVVFAYKRVKTDVIVKYVNESGATIDSDDTFSIPINTQYTFIGKHIDGFKIVDNYMSTKTVDTNLKEVIFTYRPITETIKINAKLNNTAGKILASDSFDALLGATNVNVQANNLINMLSPRYKLQSTTSQAVAVVGENTVVDFIFTEQKSNVTVNYVDLTGKVIAPQKKYDVFYGDLVTENAISIKDYYYDSAAGDATSASYHQVAGSNTVTLTFKYKSANGAISVIAKDKVTGEILSYKVENGVVGETLTVNPNTYFNGQDFLGYYSLENSETTKTPVYSNTHKEIIFLFNAINFRVTVTAEDEDGAALNFFDGTTSKSFGFKQGDDYSIYAPPVNGYESLAPKFVAGTNISADVNHTFKYKPIVRETSLAIKAIAEDGISVVGAVTINGNREEARTINAGDYPDLYDTDKWEIVGADSKDIVFGTNYEVEFSLKRKTVDVTIVHVDVTDTDNEVILRTDGPNKVGTNSKLTVVADIFPLYQLAAGAVVSRVENVGTGNVTFRVEYVRGEGNIVVEARVKGSEQVLERRYYNDGVLGLPYTLSNDKVDDFQTHTNTAYAYDSRTSLTQVVANDIDNLLIIYYTPVKATITVKYLTESGDKVIGMNFKTYEVLLGEYVDEYAMNVPFYNLTNKYPAFQEIDKVTGDTTITFEYTEILIPDGVINIIAKGSDGKILGIKSVTGVVGDQKIVQVADYFGDIVGYRLNDIPQKDAVVINGYVNVEFKYDPVKYDITIHAKDNATDAPLTFTTENKISVQQGQNVTVYAPHVDNYTVVGVTKNNKASDDFKRFTNVTGVDEVTFYYEPIGKLIVSKGIEVDAAGDPTGNTVYVQTHSGNQAGTTTINAKTTTVPNWTLVGLYNTTTGTISANTATKDVTYGTDEEVVFAYTRKMVDVTISYVEDGTGADLGSDTYTVPLNTELTVNAKAIAGYELVTASSYTKTFTVTDTKKTETFLYKKLQEGVVIEARLGSATGTVLARSSTDYALGSTNVSVNATDLNTMLSPRYILDPANQSPYTLAEVKKDSVVVFVYKEQLSTVTINYVDTTDNTKPVSTVKTYTVPYGTAIRESAKSVNDYYLDTAKSPASYSVASANAPAYTHTFFYKAAGSSITVLAKDKDTSEILYYKVYTGTQGNKLSINPTDEFKEEGFIGYYSYDSGPTMPFTYTNAHQEIVFLYEKQTYTITIKAEDDKGAALKFYDGTDTKDFTYDKGSKYTIYAPPVIGYEVKEPYFTDNKAVTTGIVADGEFTFKYEKIDMDENLIVKAVSDDGKIFIGSKVLTGERKEKAVVNITDYDGVIYDSADWKLSSAATVEATYGMDTQVVFKFTRNQVDVTVKHIKEKTGGDELETQEVIKADTNSKFNSNAIQIVGYELKATETYKKVTDIGTAAVTVEYRYVPITGNILVKAVDPSGNVLVVKGIQGANDAPFTLDQSVIDGITTQLSPGYLYDTTSVTNLGNVDSDASKNIITLKYSLRESTFKITYVDENDVPVFPEKTYSLQFGEAFSEHAVNVNFYNLTSTDTVYKGVVTEPTYNFVFKYKLVDYTISTFGVVNIIAKAPDGKGGFKILDFASKNGDINSKVEVDANAEFGTILGYVLNDTAKKEATYISGAVTVEFLYKPDSMKITIEAYDKATNLPLTFTETAIIPVLKGETKVVHAPHITKYQIDGQSYQEFTNIDGNKTAKFYYNKIDVPSTIVIKHISFVNGYQVVLETELLKGNVGEVVLVPPLSADVALDLGYSINSNYDFTKKLTHGIDTEFSFLYDRVMSKLIVNHNTEIYEKGNLTLIDTLAENDKLTLAPNLVNEEKLIANGEFTTVIAPFESNYVINTAKNTEPLRQSVQVTNGKTIDYYYRNITGNVLIRAVVEDPKGTLTINGKNYTLLAQVDDDINAGETYDATKALAVRSTLDNLIIPPYIYSGIVDGSETFTMGVDDTYEDHTITYEYTADYKVVEVSYYDNTGRLLSPSELGLASRKVSAKAITNPYTVTVIKGEYISQYAANVQNYNFASSSLNGNNTQKVYYNEQIHDETKLGFFYEPIVLIAPTQPTVINMTSSGTSLGSESIEVYPGQKIYAPYRAGYRPNNDFVIVDTDEVKPSYEFTYTKVEVPKGETVYVTEETTRDDVIFVNVPVPGEIDYSGTSFEHNKYVSGYTDGTVRPDNEITRSEVCVMLYNILRDENGDNNYVATSLSDVDQNEWYAKAVNYMTAKGYVSGYEDGTFKPYKNISRKELATILSNVFASTSNKEINALPLDPQDWATPFIVKAYSNGLYNGFNLYQYDFSQLATRAEVIVMVNNGTHRVPNETYLSTKQAPSDLSKSHWAYYHILESLYDHDGHYEGIFGDEFEVIEE